MGIYDNKVNYKLIDILKFLFCLSIIGIHTNFLSTQATGIQWYIIHIIVRLSIPFYFTASGFFLGLKLKGNNTIKVVIINYIKRMIYPLFVFTILNLPFQFYYYLNYTTLLGSVIRIIRDMIFYPQGALWFIQACIVAVMLLWYFIKKDKLNLAIKVGMVLYLFALICNSYYFLVEDNVFKSVVDIYLKVCISPRNGVFVGFIFMSIGIKISYYNLNNVSIRKILYAFIISYIILFIEASIIFGKTLKDDHSLFLIYPIIIPLLFIIASKINLPESKIYVRLRNLSVGMYFLHPIIRNIYEILAYEYLKYTFIEFIIVSIVSFLICIGSYLLNNEKLNRLLK